MLFFGFSAIFDNILTLWFVSLAGDQQNAAFVFVSMSDIFCCFLSMGLVFVPKLLFIRRHAHDPRERGGEEEERKAKEEEREHREVLRDNETLKKKLEEVGIV